MILRHTERTAYRCFLPDLAGFTGFCCTGPSPFPSLVRGQELGVRRAVDGESENRFRILSYTLRLTPNPSRTYGGEGGIRTHGPIAGTHAFQACRFVHSRTSPRQFSQGGILTRGLTTSKAIAHARRRDIDVPLVPF